MVKLQVLASVIAYPCYICKLLCAVKCSSDVEYGLAFYKKQAIDWKRSWFEFTCFVLF